MYYYGNLIFGNNRGRATVRDGIVYGFNGQQYTTSSAFPRMAQCIMDAYLSAGTITKAQAEQDLQALRNAQPFCNCSDKSKTVQAILAFFNAPSMEDEYRDSPVERILKVYAHNRNLTYKNVLTQQNAHQISKLLETYSEKDVIEFINYLAKEQEDVCIPSLDDMKQYQVEKKLFRLLPNNGAGIPSAQIRLALKLGNDYPNNLEDIAAMLRNGLIHDLAIIENENRVDSPFPYIGAFGLAAAFLKMKKLIGSDEKPSGNIIAKIAKMAIQYNSKKDEIFSRQMQEVAEKLTFNTDDFVVILPQSEADLIEEGNQMHNCVGRFNYYYRTIDRVSFIVFIRHANCPNKSFITCEIDSRGRILQAFAKQNSRIEDKGAIQFIKDYAQHLRKVF